jgi:hypothetical protein
MGMLAQFLLRLAFGLAVGMAVTSPAKVSSGFFRNHLYVTLGLTTLATLLLTQIFLPGAIFAALAALFSFLGAASWLYEAKRIGWVMVVGVAWGSFTSAEIGQASVHEDYVVINAADEAIASTSIKMKLDEFHAIWVLTSGLVLGFTFAAMLLGHWYLNSPGMELAPLRRLLVAAAVAIVAHSAVVGAGFVAELSTRSDISMAWLLFVLLRWSFGLVGVLALLWMAWRTLDIPNTQSATGILYVAVIGVFIGELTGLLLSAESAYPL